MSKALPLIKFWDLFKPLVRNVRFVFLGTNGTFHIKTTAGRLRTHRFLLGLKNTFITVLSDQENGLSLYRCWVTFSPIIRVQIKEIVEDRLWGGVYLAQMNGNNGEIQVTRQHPVKERFINDRRLIHRVIFFFSE